MSKSFDISNEPVLFLDSIDYIIPSNTYANIIYNGPAGDIFLPKTQDSINGQCIAIRNNSIGNLNIKVQDIDKIQSYTGDINNYSLSSAAYISFVCNVELAYWTILQMPSSISSDVVTNNTNVNNLYATGSQINVISNLNLDAKKMFMNPINIGVNTGVISQDINTIAIGKNAGNNDQKQYSIAIGIQAGETSQGFTATGAHSIAIGYQSASNAQRLNSIAIGYQADTTNMGGNAIAIGNLSGQNNNTVSNSINIGSLAGAGSIGASAIAIGYQTCQRISTNLETIVIGKNSGNIFRNSCVVIGKDSGGPSTSPAINSFLNIISIGNETFQTFPATLNTLTNTTSIGYQSMQNITSQVFNNTYIGTGAGKNPTSSTIIGVGYQCADGNGIGSGLCAMGKNTCRNNIGVPNLIIGNEINVTSVNHIFSTRIGSKAGNITNSYTQCNFIGFEANFTGNGANATHAFGYRAKTSGGSIIFNASGAEESTGDATIGKVFISPMGTSTNPANMVWNNTTGIIDGIDPYEVIVRTSDSDIRIKKNIEDLDDDECLNILNNFSAKKFNYIDDDKTDIYGFIAQDIKPTAPFAVNTITDYIPDIWQAANFQILDDKVKIFLPIEIMNTLSITDKIKIIDKKDNNSYECDIEIIESDGFVTTISEPITEMWVYGRLVNDVHFYYADYLWAVSWGAAQQLLKRIENIEAQLNQIV
jgi:hypothetical protein